MLELPAQIGAVAFELTLVAWVLPRLLTRVPLTPRWLSRAVARVKWLLTWPGRSQAERTAGRIALRMHLREHDPRYRELMILGPGATYEPLSSDALVQLAAGRPPTAAPAPISQWAPNLIAAMPRDRCASCPAFGCAAAGVNPECKTPRPRPHAYRPDCGCQQCSDVVSYEEVTTHNQVEPVAYIPTGRASDRGHGLSPSDADAIIRSVWDRQASNPDHLAEAQRMIEESLRGRP